MSFQSKQWIRDYKDLKTKIQAKRQTGLLCSQVEVKELTNGAELLTKQLISLQQAAMEHEISFSEISRRQVILENMKKHITMIPQVTEGNAVVRESFGIDSSRTSTTASNKPSIVGSNNMNYDNYNNSSNSSSGTFNPMSSNTSNQGLVQRQHEIIRKQDEMLVDISKGVEVLHRQALDINEEAKVHIQILDKLDTNVEKATEGLKTEAEHAERVRRTSSICFMYIMIVIEIVIIVLLLILMFSL